MQEIDFQFDRMRDFVEGLEEGFLRVYGFF